MNELLLLVTALMSALFVVGGWKLGKDRLYSVIIVFLILIATVGGKFAVFFGHTTNTGNIFYASVFLATYFLIERYGRKEGIYSIWVGVIAVVFFFTLTQLAVALAGSDTTAPFNEALAIRFDPMSRVALASLYAYALSQSLNVYLFIFFKERMQQRYLWLRANLSNLFAQIFDSSVFFILAFGAVIPSLDMWDVILTSLAIKVVFMMFAAPLLYLNKFEEGEAAENVITLA